MRCMAKRNFKREAASLAASVLQANIEIGALTTYAEKHGLDESDLEHLTEHMYAIIEALTKKSGENHVR